MYTAETPCISRQLPPPCSQVNNLFIRTEAFYFHSIISPYLDLSLPLSIEEIRGEEERKEKNFLFKKMTEGSERRNDARMNKMTKIRRPDLFKKFKLSSRPHFLNWIIGFLLIFNRFLRLPLSRSILIFRFDIVFDYFYSIFS